MSRTNRGRNCKCSKKTPGRPKLWRGICGWPGRVRVLRWRAQSRELNRAVLRGLDPEGDAVGVLARASAKE
jgi:hypothetical protein